MTMKEMLKNSSIKEMTLRLYEGIEKARDFAITFGKVTASYARMYAYDLRSWFLQVRDEYRELPMIWKCTIVSVSIGAVLLDFLTPHPLLPLVGFELKHMIIVESAIDAISSFAFSTVFFIAARKIRSLRQVLGIAFIVDFISDFRESYKKEMKKQNAAEQLEFDFA